MDCILLFVKYPDPGAVKTRLAKDSSAHEAALLYRVMVEALVERLGGHADVDLIVCYSPENRRDDFQGWLGERRLLSQKGMELGRRMENAFREAFFMGYDRAVLVGSDIPMLNMELMLRALKSVDQNRAVLGPAADGGYYLIGFDRYGFVPKVFRNMLWSREDVLAETMKRFAESDISVQLMPEMADIDTLDDVVSMVEVMPDSLRNSRLGMLLQDMVAAGVSSTILQD